MSLHDLVPLMFELTLDTAVAGTLTAHFAVNYVSRTIFFLFFYTATDTETGHAV